MHGRPQSRPSAWTRRKLVYILLAAIIALCLYRYTQRPTLYVPQLKSPDQPAHFGLSSEQAQNHKEKFNWAALPQNYPVAEYQELPAPLPKSQIPKIQASHFPTQDAAYKRVQKERLAAVKGNFTHAWQGYRKHAWLRDEVAPLSGGYHDAFGGWAASLVDALGTLWIMGMHEEFEEAVDAVEHIDFSTCALDTINVFETTIRYLGGFLSAHDLTQGEYPILLSKAVELGEMLYHAFDTPNRMPVMRWKFMAALRGEQQEAGSETLVAEIGSLTLEFTRLAQLTGNEKYYDAVQRVMDVFDQQQNQTKLPGMWPVVVNAQKADFREFDGFTLGGMSDSLYEYLPKQHILMGGGSTQYQKLYEASLATMKQNIFYRPMTPKNSDILLAGQVHSNGNTPVAELVVEPQAQHLACFAGGMVGVGARIFKKEEDIEIARKLVEGCLWGYESSRQGIMPEIIHTVPCDDKVDCPWDADKWYAALARENKESNLSEDELKDRLTPGVVKVDDPRYLLRPEAIESVWYLYRLTGDPTLQDRAWDMFNTIIKHSKTDIAHAALIDCTVENPPKSDSMESFWLAETLLYFYLIFSDPDVVSLDEFVLNTEAHAFRRVDR